MAKLWDYLTGKIVELDDSRLNGGTPNYMPGNRPRYAALHNDGSPVPEEWMKSNHTGRTLVLSDNDDHLIPYKGSTVEAYYGPNYGEVRAYFANMPKRCTYCNRLSHTGDECPGCGAPL